VPKFELYKHKDELFNIITGFFMNLIEQFWPFEEISIFNNGGHLGYRTALTDTILKGDHLRIISELFLTYITGFFMYFELLPILTDYAN
jgi:hypothetical protein